MSYIVKRIITSITLILLIYLSLKNSYVLTITLLALSYFSINEFSNIYKIIYKKKKFLRFVTTMLSIFYVSLFSLIVWFNVVSTQYILTLQLIFLLLICISTDIGGFIFGKIIGGKKLTKISPNKTISGFFGSLFLSVFALFFLVYILTKNFELGFFIVGIVTSIACQIGDLFFSYLKRKSKLDDTGNILPGHGGILDRVDGILLGLPVGIFSLLTFF